MSGFRDWLRRKLGLHVHEWGPVETFTIGGQEYDDGRVHYIIGKRTMHYQECATCGRCDFVYPFGLRLPFFRRPTG